MYGTDINAYAMSFGRNHGGLLPLGLAAVLFETTITSPFTAFTSSDRVSPLRSIPTDVSWLQARVVGPEARHDCEHARLAP